MSELAKIAIVAVPGVGAIGTLVGILAVMPSGRMGLWETAIVIVCGLGGMALGYVYARHEAVWHDAYQAETDAIMAWLDGKGPMPPRMTE